jgi:HAD superfamily hydrolase (TIGR01509 family)
MTEQKSGASQHPVPRALLFDFYGVLFPARFAAWVNEHAKDQRQRDHFFEMANASDRGEQPKREFYAELGRLSGTSLGSVEYALHHNQQPLPGMLELLRSLAEPYTVGILSNSDARIVRDLLDAFDVSRLLSAVVLSTEVGMIKPEPGIFQLALTQLGTAAAECVFIDDTVSHVAAAERYGLRGVVFTTKEALEQELHTLLKF